MTSWTNTSKNSASWGNTAKSDPNMSAQTLLIDDTYELLIDGTYNLLIQPAVSSTAWNNQAKS